MDIAGIYIPKDVVPIQEMTRDKWIFFTWANVGSIQPVYLCMGMRDISEADTAAKQFDAWVQASRAQIETRTKNENTK